MRRDCDEIGPKFVNRSGGYTRIYRLGPRLGDGAEMAILELVEQSEAGSIAQRRKLIQRRTLVEVKKEKKTREKKVKEKKPKAKEKVEEKKAKPTQAPKTKSTKKKTK